MPKIVQLLPWSNAFWPLLTPFGPPMWQAEADTELTLSASPTTEVGQKALALAKRRYSTVYSLQNCIGRKNHLLLKRTAFLADGHPMLWKSFFLN